MPGRDDPHDVLRELCDLRCQRLLTPRLLKWANVALLGLCAYALIWLIWWAFQRSLWLGLAHLLVIAPLASLAALVLTRVLLEVCLATLDIRAHVVELGEIPRRVTGWPALQKLAALGDWRAFSVTRVESTQSTRR
jgi:hypothetical protein